MLFNLTTLYLSLLIFGMDFNMSNSTNIFKIALSPFLDSMGNLFWVICIAEIIILMYRYSSIDKFLAPVVFIPIALAVLGFLLSGTIKLFFFFFAVIILGWMLYVVFIKKQELF